MRARLPQKTILERVLDKPGAKPYLTDTENAIFVEREKAQGTAAAPVDQHRLKAHGRHVMSELSNDTSIPAEQQARYQNARCGKNWMRTSLKRNNEFQGVTAGGWQKPSPISVARAQAADPERKEAVFNGMQTLLERLYKQGDIPSAEFPPAQSHCMDEIGSGDNVKMRMVLAQPGCKEDDIERVRVFKLTDGEKANIWVTLGLFTRLDGQVRGCASVVSV